MTSDIVWPIVAAIDFGTSNSGYAYSYENETVGDKRVIHVNEWLVSKDNNKHTEKTPTTILLNPEGGFEEFGYEAEYKYAQLCRQKKETSWYYFRHFKMLLYKCKNLTTNTLLLDECEKEMPAIDVFVIAIRFLKDHLLSRIAKSKLNVTYARARDSILWVLTVPAIWSDAAKQFMRQAAIQADIPNSNLRLVLEPEAASVYCRYASLKFLEGQECGKSFNSLPVGFRYIIADLGGGTVDIAVHEVTEDENIHELYNAVGNDMGGSQFNSNFLKFLSDLIGVKFDEWKTDARKKYIETERKIEGIKCSLSNKDAFVDFATPSPLQEKVKWSRWDSLGEFLSQSKYKRKASAVDDDDEMQLQIDFVKSFFDATIEGIHSKLRNIVKEIKRVNAIVLVGGLANSAYIYESVKKEFPQQNVIVPEDAGLAVLKGAVLLGNNPTLIAGRISRYTYGTEIALRFEEGIHPEDCKTIRDGEVMCKNVFHKIIEKGQVLKYGERLTSTQQITAKQRDSKTTVYHIPLFQSTIDFPIYTTSIGCTYLGEVLVEPPEGGWPDHTYTSTEIVVGDAEFKLFVKESNGREYETKVDFLFPQE